MRNLWMKLDETFVTGAFAPRPSAHWQPWVWLGHATGCCKAGVLFRQVCNRVHRAPAKTCGTDAKGGVLQSVVTVESNSKVRKRLQIFTKFHVDLQNPSFGAVAACIAIA